MYLPVCGGGSNRADTSDDVDSMFVGGGSFYCKTLLKDNYFSGFNESRKECGGTQAAIGVNIHAPNYVPIANFVDTYFFNTGKDALAYFSSPS